MEINEKDLAKIIEIMTAKNLLITDTFDILEKTPKIIGENDEIELVVNYKSTLRQVLSNNHFTHRDVGFDEKNCPTPKELIGKEVKVLAKLFYFEATVSKTFIEKKMEEAGFRQANIRELLSFSRLNIKPREKPKESLEGSLIESRIAALGFTKNDYCPYVSYWHNGSKYLDKILVFGEHLISNSGYVLGIKK